MSTTTTTGPSLSTDASSLPLFSLERSSQATLSSQGMTSGGMSMAPLPFTPSTNALLFSQGTAGKDGLYGTQSREGRRGAVRGTQEVTPLTNTPNSLIYPSPTHPPSNPHPHSHFTHSLSNPPPNTLSNSPFHPPLNPPCRYNGHKPRLLVVVVGVVVVVCST